LQPTFASLRLDKAVIVWPTRCQLLEQKSVRLNQFSGTGQGLVIHSNGSLEYANRVVAGSEPSNPKAFCAK